MEAVLKSKPDLSFNQMKYLILISILKLEKIRGKPMVLKSSETRNSILKRGLGQMNLGNKDFKLAILNKLLSLMGSPICTVKTCRT